MRDFEGLLGSRIIDLTVPLSPDYPGWWPSSHPLTVARTDWYDNPRAPYFNRLVTLDEHTGTHMDAPAHFIPDPALGLPNATVAGKITTEKVELERLIVLAAVLNCSDLLDSGAPGISPVIERSRLEDFEKRTGKLNRGEGLLLYTGWSDRYYRKFPEGRAYAEMAAERTSPGWPVLEAGALEYALDRGVTLVGTDCPSVGAAQSGIENHVAGLGRAAIFIESLINLGQLPARDSLFVFLPLALIGGSGAPGRAIAFVAGTPPPKP